MKYKILVLAFTVIGFGGSGQAVKYRNLVMEGGGVKGFAYSGALQVLDSMGMLQPMERVAGTSVGAIQAALLAVGYTPAEILELTADVPLKKFNDGGWAFVGGIKRLRTKFGWYKGRKIADWVEKLIAVKTGNGKITFGELHALAGKDYKDLYITGTDLTYQCLRVFSHEQYPAMRVRDAVRISLSIPLYYQAVLMDDSGRVFEKPTGKPLHVMVDGGVLSNYPVFVFDSTRYMRGGGVDEHRVNPETLGLIMEIPEQIDYNARRGGIYPFPIGSMTAYLRALYHTLIDKVNPEVTHPGGVVRTISISNMNLSGRVRRLPRSTILQLQEQGREAVRRFFAGASQNLHKLE